MICSAVLVSVGTFLSWKSSLMFEQVPSKELIPDRGSSKDTADVVKTNSDDTANRNLILLSDLAGKMLHIPANGGQRTNYSEKVQRDDIELIFQTPSSLGIDTESKGIILMLHGCIHSANNFFLQSSACPECLPMPAEYSLKEEALSHGFTVAAVNSIDRTHGCWNLDQDAARVRAAAQWIASRLGLKAAPVAAL
eukprot:CAMPEP_0113662952 /NCGR_PEP_ID=MMETSP0038_2-20120614/867_1 /TAXON_ID=2898 /ORGANISM="Cryptomonas paramecium" /LENGTH=194 /DNA_ID=CAMNT_0000577915 /DNA_START=44 /DNA_END=625 /DNA_ORIENTATION=- /assembly_acc=CAM_ASM_000170